MPNSDLTFLVIDDDPAEIQLMREALTEGLPNVNIRTIINGAEALEELKGSTKLIVPDAILMDYHMPIMSGLGFLRNIAIQEKFAKVPLIVWTRRDDANIAEECRKAGATLVKTKPYDNHDHLIFAKELGILARASKKLRSG